MATIIIAIIVFGGIGFAVYSMVKNRNKGCTGCGGGCAGCAKAKDPAADCRNTSKTS
ncbi:MAG: FeoB-associated Cys-rich membrane protein [Christensenellaceae bacterium]|jgi:hypothetical protein